MNKNWLSLRGFDVEDAQKMKEIKRTAEANEDEDWPEEESIEKDEEDEDGDIVMG